MRIQVEYQTVIHRNMNLTKWWDVDLEGALRRYVTAIGELTVKRGRGEDEAQLKKTIEKSKLGNGPYMSAREIPITRSSVRSLMAP